MEQRQGRARSEGNLVVVLNGVVRLRLIEKTGSEQTRRREEIQAGRW